MVIYGVIGSNTTPIHCPAGGCSSDYLWWASFPYLASFFLGLSLISERVILLVMSKRAKPDQQDPAIQKPDVLKQF
ncbi:MAG TPA: hypothetical protein VFE98_04560 [Candidatus Bathyarchaeia archaeon]|nr:hypothetical protein [Candidatus Bathyarchaeia archaeon]